MNVVQAVSELPPPLPGYVRVVRVESPDNNRKGGLTASVDYWEYLPSPGQEGYADEVGRMRQDDMAPVCGAHPHTFEKWFTKPERIADCGLGVFCFDVPEQHAWQGIMQIVFKRHEARLIARLH